jgi:hypothetical protein
MDTLNFHIRPKLNNDRRKWLKSLEPGDAVVMVEPRSFIDESPERMTFNYEELFVVAREGASLHVASVLEGGPLEFDRRGEWSIPGEERENDMPDAWILDPADPAVKLMRRIICAAEAMAKMGDKGVGFYVDQLRRALAQPVEHDAHQSAKRLIERAMLMYADLSSQGCRILGDDGTDPLAAAA